MEEEQQLQYDKLMRGLIDLERSNALIFKGSTILVDKVLDELKATLWSWLSVKNLI